MNNSANANLPQSGGTVLFAYNMKECQGDNVVSWIESGDTEWFTVEYVPDGESSSGTVRITCEAITDFVTRRIYLEPSISGKTCNGILVSQVTCDCGDVDTMIFTPIPASGITSTTTIGSWKLIDNTDCKSAPKIYVDSETPLPEGVTINVVSDPNDPRRGTFTVDSFPENEKFYELNTWNIKMYYKTTDPEDICTTYALIQNGKKVECNCKYSRYFVTTLKTTFPKEGTEGVEDRWYDGIGWTMLIGSGHTDCGYLECNAESSDILAGGVVKSEHIDEGENKGDFSFYARLLPATQDNTRTVGLKFSLYDQFGHLLEKDCSSDSSLYRDGLQTSGYCECISSGTNACILGFNGYHYVENVWVPMEGRYVKTNYVYVGGYQAGEVCPCVQICPMPNPIYSCNSGVYVDYDENMFASNYRYDESTRTYEYEYEHIGNSCLYLYFKEGVWTNQNMTLTFRVREYVDAFFDYDEDNKYRLIRGYPCSEEMENTVVVTPNCSCDMENGKTTTCPRDSSSSSSSYSRDYDDYEWVEASGGTFDIYIHHICADPDNDTVEFTYNKDSGSDWLEWVDDEVKTDEYGGKYVRISVSPNTTQSYRYGYVYVYPNIGYYECNGYIVEVSQSYTEKKDYCSDCEHAIDGIDYYTYHYDYCDDTNPYFIPYYFKSGYDCDSRDEIRLTILSTVPADLLTYNVVEVRDDEIHLSYHNDTGSPWEIEVKGEIVRNGTPIFDGCASVTATFEYDTCQERPEPTCSCYSARFEDTSQGDYNSGQGVVDIGNLYATNCISYSAETTQTSALDAYIEDNKVKANIKTVSSPARVSIDVTARYNGDLCDEWHVFFDINP